VRADVSSSVMKAFFLVQFGYLEVTVQEKLHGGWPGPFVRVVISHSFAFSANRRLKFSSRVFRSNSPGQAVQWLARPIREC
jgi:hypothetical protein